METLASYRTNVLFKCKALNHRRQGIYGQLKLSPEQYEKYPTRDMYKLEQEKCRNGCQEKKVQNAITP